MIGHYTASIINHYHTSNLMAIFLDFTLGELQTASLSHSDNVIYTILAHTADDNNTVRRGAFMAVTVAPIKLSW